jgi:hypothetical protein
MRTIRVHFAAALVKLKKVTLSVPCQYNTAFGKRFFDVNGALV